MPTSFEQVTDEVDDRVRGAVDDRGHRFREPDPLVDRRGLAAHDEDPLDGPRDADALRELVEHRQDGAGVHAVRVERAVVRGPVQVVFEQVERAGRVTVPYRVDEDERAVAVQQPVGEVHAADADVRDLHAVGQVAAGQPARHLDAEPVVGEEDVADTGYENPVHGSSISSGWK